MQVQELAPGLWRWTAPHPEWTEGADWPREVGCVYVETAGTVVLIDPLVPTNVDARATFLEHLDADVERNGKPVAILVTLPWHVRSAAELAERHDAEVWASSASAEQVDGVVTNPFEPGQVLPGGVIGLDAQREGETMYWLPEHRALVPGDSLLGDGDGGVRIPPDSWFEDVPPAEFKLALRGLLDLPVERVLVSHGEPVLTDGHAALERALAS
jgi:glyoxylase-like metal-dependent hydrolase (beta-lactamase superfamily II)